jgi:high-affinity nickel permease
MIASLLALGFLLGLKHALDADHVAAVASLASRTASLRDTLKVGSAWGVGHAAVLLVVASALVALGASMPPSLARVFEAVVGIVLVLLGLDVLRRLRRLAPAAHHDHEERTTAKLVSRALVVGSLHGLAGTAGLMLLAVPAAPSWMSAVAYVFVFGIGTVIGMLVISTMLSVPFILSKGKLSSARVVLEGLLGATNLVLGCWISLTAIS